MTESEALRRYRELVRTLIDRRYSDGAVDGATMFSFVCDIEEIEEALKETEDES